MIIILDEIEILKVNVSKIHSFFMNVDDKVNELVEKHEAMIEAQDLLEMRHAERHYSVILGN